MRAGNLPLPPILSGYHGAAPYRTASGASPLRASWTPTSATATALSCSIASVHMALFHRVAPGSGTWALAPGAQWS